MRIVVSNGLSSSRKINLTINEGEIYNVEGRKWSGEI